MKACGFRSACWTGLLLAITFRAAVDLKGLQPPAAMKPLYLCRVACGISTSSSKLRCPFVSVWPSPFNFSVIRSLDMVWLQCSTLFLTFCLGFLFIMVLIQNEAMVSFSKKQGCIRAEMVLRLFQAPRGEHSLPWSRSSLIACLSPGCSFPCYEKLNVFTSLPLSFCGGAIKKQQIAFFCAKPVYLS